MARYFTVEDAELLLPRIRLALRRIGALNEEYRQAETEIQEASQRIMMLGGVRVDLGRLTNLKERRDSAGARLKQALDSLHGYGCLLKDMDAGLVDFPTQLRGEEVYLCWKLGEPGIRFWHGVQEGYQGRKPIDREFLENHHGGGTD